MKKLLIPAFLFLPMLSFAYGNSSDDSGDTLLLIGVGIIINLLIIWGIINHATRADRILKAQLAQIHLMQKLLESKGVFNDFEQNDLIKLNKQIKDIDMTKKV